MSATRGDNPMSKKLPGSPLETGVVLARQRPRVHGRGDPYSREGPSFPPEGEFGWMQDSSEQRLGHRLDHATGGWLERADCDTLDHRGGPPDDEFASRFPRPSRPIAPLRP